MKEILTICDLNEQIEETKEFLNRYNLRELKQKIHCANFSRMDYKNKNPKTSISANFYAIKNAIIINNAN